MSNQSINDKCAIEYCQLPVEPGVSDSKCIGHSKDLNKSPARMEAAVAEIRSSTQAACRGWMFPNNLVLTGASLTIADFREVEFRGTADFSGATFAGPTDFSGCAFRGSCDFSQANFVQRPPLGRIEFAGAQFDASAVFLLATFDEADFQSCRFRGTADFTRMTARRATFTECDFVGATEFRELSAADGIAFVRSKFVGRTEFDRTDMTLVTFNACEATAVSLRNASRLSSGEFHGVRWPLGIAEEQDARSSNQLQSYRDAERVYRELRRGADERRQQGDADWAYRRELEMRRLAYRVVTPGPRGAIRAEVASLEALYRLTSDYGSSLWRPVLYLAAFVLVVFPYLFAYQGVAIDNVTYSIVGVGNAPGGNGWPTLAMLSLRIAALLPEPPSVTFTPGSTVVLIGLRIIGPLFGFLFSLAVRRQLRR